MHKVIIQYAQDCDAPFPVLNDCCNFTMATTFCIATDISDFNIAIVIASQFFLLSKDKCKMLTKMLTLSKVTRQKQVEWQELECKKCPIENHANLKIDNFKKIKK